MFCYSNRNCLMDSGSVLEYMLRCTELTVQGLSSYNMLINNNELPGRAKDACACDSIVILSNALCRSNASPS
ncbi:hypothetical protein HHUSO_G24262 [Huso huso]|uniref:Uncharacterized protein n=1 Tax=Huso huso TaxID=61971 RepID=A0ABR0YUD3_HUSHU